MANKQITRNTFGVKQHTFDVPNLNAMQIESYQSFWEQDLKEILAEFSPIEDTVGERWKVKLGPKFTLEESEIDEYTALLKGQTYGSRLSVLVTVENLVTKQKKMQEVFVGNVPVMTSKGNFIVNGTQKIVVGQLVKSPGVVFNRGVEKGVYIYSAKIIPTRGIWIDLEISHDGIMYARIDRKKKMPATQLLRLHGLTKEQDIIEMFKDVDVDENVSVIQNTLDTDQTFSIDDAVNSIYKKLRPGDIVSIEQGKKYLLSLFTDETRYDFGKVGRFKFDDRLNFESGSSIEKAVYKKTIGVEEIAAVMKELIRLRVNQMESDNIDSLSNRRVRAVGEWLGNTFKAGLARVVRNTKDKMTTSEDANFTPAQLVNMRPLAAMIEDFFNTSQLSRFMDQTNIVSEVDDRMFLTCTGPGGLQKERAGFDVRDVHLSHYGRLCPINTPEGSAFGLNTHLAIYARINRLGFLETPYYKVKEVVKASNPELISRVIEADVEYKGKKLYKKGQLITKDIQESLAEDAPDAEIQVKRFVSKEVAWLDAQDELEATIAENIGQIDDLGIFDTPMIGARRNGEPVQAPIDEVQYMDVSSNQIFSLSTCLIPFVAQTDGFRVLMGTNQQGQALPLVRPENPYVATGFESAVARDSGYLITAEFDGIISKVDGNGVTVEGTTGKSKFYKTLKYLPSNNHSAINQHVLVKPGQAVQAGDALIEGFGIHNQEFAIGQNVRVAFMPFKGYNFEDAIVLSERLVHQDKFTSNHIYELTCDVHETRLGNEEITRDIPNVSTDKLKKLDKEGIIHVGAYVESGDILIGKITPKGEVDLSPEDKLIRVLFGEYSRDVKDSSLYLEHGLSGKVISIRIFSRENGDILPNDVTKRVHIWLAVTRKIKPGDKMAGRHGNKGVVSVVLPQEDMPYSQDGRPVDIILNPLGVVSRMNIGQLLETHLGLVCEKNGEYAVTQPLNEITREKIQEELQQAGFQPDGKMTLWDGQTGEQYDRQVVVGNLYLNKLHHLVDDKIHTRSTGPYSLVTQQPLGGRSHSGGQRFGEMEVWALEAYGAAYALQEMLTIKSDDVKGRDAAFESIIKNKPIVSPNLPGSFVVLANELTALGIKVNAKVTHADDSSKIDEDLALSVDQGSLS